MTEARIEAGTLTANLEERIVSGLVLKFGEVGRTNLGRFSVEKGAFKLPKDIHTFMGLDLFHDRTKQVGTALMAQETDEGIYASWKIADNADGNALLAQWSSGDPEAPRKLSIEVDDVVLKGGVAVSGNIHGAAVVKAGAFPSATLMAADTPDAPDAGGETTSSYESTSKNADGSEYSDKTETTEQREELPDGSVRITRTTVTVTEVKEPDAPAEEETSAMGVPATLAASAANLVTPEGKDNEKSAREVFTLMASAMQGDDEARTLLAALTDIKVTGTGALPVAGVLQPSWLGEVWAQKAYQRRYMPLIRQGNITAIDEKGFTVSASTEPVQPWNGNKSAVPSSGGTTQVLSSTFQKWAWAADIAREFFDIPGNTEVIDAFMRLVLNSYARVTDKWTLAQLVGSASTVAPETFPTLDPSRDFPYAAKLIIQGIDAVSADPVDDSPSFAIVNAAAWKQLIYAGKDGLPEFLQLSFGIEEQGGTAGRVQVVRGDIGIDDTPAVLVGAKDAAHVNELPGAAPLSISAVDIANGGIDKSNIGYTQYMADYAAALVRVGVADS